MRAQWLNDRGLLVLFLSIRQTCARTIESLMPDYPLFALAEAVPLVGQISSIVRHIAPLVMAQRRRNRLRAKTNFASRINLIWAVQSGT